ncbi:hypothetical protein JCM10550A_23200 [Methanogenium cariaci]
MCNLALPSEKPVWRQSPGREMMPDTPYVTDMGCAHVGGMYSRMQQMAEGAAIIPRDYGALFDLSGQNRTGSNLAGGICQSTLTRTRTGMRDVPVLGGLILPQYPLLLKKRLSILS